MTSVCDTVSESVLVSSSVGEVTMAFTIERATASDALSFVIAYLASDSVDVTDAAAQVVASMLSDTIDATSAAEQVLLANSLVVDTIAVDDVPLSSYSVTVSDQADITDATTHRLRHAVVESIVAGDVVLAPAQAATVIVDSAVVADICPPFMTNYVIDSVEISDAVSSLNTASVEVSDSIDVTDAAASSATYRQQVADTIAATSSVTMMLSAVNTVVDEAFVQDYVTGPAGAGWTAHAGTWGMSRYTNMPFNGIAAIDDQIVLTSDDGFYTMNADNDGSSEVAASIDLGASEGRNGYLRRPREIYIGYNGGRLAAVVAGAVNGTKVEYTYPFPVQTASTDTAAKVEPGRGLRSRYFRFGFENQNGARFLLRDARIIFDDTSRRV